MATVTVALKVQELDGSAGELHRSEVADAHCELLHVAPLMLCVDVGSHIAKLNPDMVAELCPDFARFTSGADDTTGASNVKDM